MITEQPRVTIIVPVTRNWALPMLFDQLDALVCDHSKTDLIIYIDTNNPSVIKGVSDYVADRSPFYRTMTDISGNGEPNEVRISVRRNRIVDGREKQKKLIADDSEFIFGFEDDSCFPADSIQRMLPVIMRPEVGFIEGVQVGRWMGKYIGAWRVNNIQDPTQILSMPLIEVGKKQGKFLEQIDAGGFYCYMTKTALFKGIDSRWHDECFGPDVCFGLDLRRQGFKNYIDWGLIVGHNDFGKILLPEGKIETVLYNKINNKWTLVQKGEQC